MIDFTKITEWSLEYSLRYSHAEYSRTTTKGNLCLCLTAKLLLLRNTGFKYNTLSGYFEPTGLISSRRELLRVKKRQEWNAEMVIRLMEEIGVEFFWFSECMKVRDMLRRSNEEFSTSIITIGRMHDESFNLQFCLLKGVNCGVLEVITHIPENSNLRIMIQNGKIRENDGEILTKFIVAMWKSIKGNPRKVLNFLSDNVRRRLQEIHPR